MELNPQGRTEPMCVYLFLVLIPFFLSDISQSSMKKEEIADTTHSPQLSSLPTALVSPADTVRNLSASRPLHAHGSVTERVTWT